MVAEKSFLAWLASEPGKAALAGAAGGLVRWITLRDSWREGVPALFVGAVAPDDDAPRAGGVRDRAGRDGLSDRPDRGTDHTRRAQSAIVNPACAAGQVAA